MVNIFQELPSLHERLDDARQSLDANVTLTVELKAELVDLETAIGAAKEKAIIDDANSRAEVVNNTNKLCLPRLTDQLLSL